MSFLSKHSSYPFVLIWILLRAAVVAISVTNSPSTGSNSSAVAIETWCDCGPSNVIQQQQQQSHSDLLNRVTKILDLLTISTNEAMTIEKNDLAVSEISPVTIDPSRHPYGSSSPMFLHQQQQHEEAVSLLRSLQNDLIHRRPSQQQQENRQQQQQRPEQTARRRRRHLEEDDQEDAADEDDSSNYYNSYRQKSSSDVEITFDEEENTVVTVGDDVIVFVDHGYMFYVYNCGMIGLCIIVGATMAGLLMGVMSLDPLLVSVKARTATTQHEQEQALTLLPFVQNKNIVLVSLLLVNCGTNEALPVFLDNLLENPLLTVILSLTVVLVVGEILPSAYFTGRDQVTSACKLVPVLRFVIIITSPISYPLAKLMDHYFHPSSEVSAMKRGEITAMVRIQYEDHLAWKRRHAAANDVAANKKDDANADAIQRSDTTSTVNSSNQRCDTADFCTPCEPLSYIRNTELYACMIPYQQGNCNGMVLSNVPSFSNPHHQDLGDDDILKLEGALTMKDKKVHCAYTPMNRVVSIMADTILDENTVVQLYSYGYSRIPVMQQYLDDDDDKNAVGICGIVLTKQLMLIGKEDRRRVSSLTMYEPPCVSPRASLAEALNMILAGKRKSSNMALVCTEPDIARKALQNTTPIPMEAGVLGIITLENILEELIQEPILDEKDKKMNPKVERAKWAIGKWKAFVLRKRIQNQDTEFNGSGTTSNNNNSMLHNMDHPFDYVTMNEVV